MFVCAGTVPASAQTIPDSTSIRPESPALIADGTLLTLPPPQVRRWQVGLLRPDRIQHASVSFVLAAGIGIASERRATAFGFALGVGLLKECWDARHGRFDPTDLTADAAGALLGTLTLRSR